MDKSTHRLALKRLDRLDMLIHIVRHGLELAQDALGLVNDSLVLEHRAVVRDVYVGRLRRVLGLDALGLGMAFTEGLEGCDGLCKWLGLYVGERVLYGLVHTLAETEGGVDASPVLQPACERTQRHKFQVQGLLTMAAARDLEAMSVVN
jgi:hypothetical protein